MTLNNQLEYSLELIFKKRAMKYAEEPTDKTNSIPHSHWLTLSAGQARVLIPLSQTLVVQRMSTIIEIPWLTHPLMGLAIYRDEVVPLVDLLALVETPCHNSLRNQGFLILMGQRQHSIGLYAPDLGSVIQVSNTIEELMRQQPLKHRFLRLWNEYLILDVDFLNQHLEKSNVKGVS